MYHLLQFYIDISEKTLYNYVIKKGGKKMKNTTNRKNFKNSRAISVLLVVIMLFAALPFAFSVSANSDNGIVYAGGKIKATVEFAKDIPEGVPCYLFEFEYDGSSLSYSETENHWALNPLTVPHPDWDQPALSCSAFTAVGPEVKAGEKLVSFTFDVTKEINVDELSFSYAEFQLYNNDAVELDSSYFAYSVEVVSQGNVPTEPETEPTTVPVTEPTEPETEPTTVPVTEPTEPETEPTTVPVTEPTEPETEPTVPVTEPTEPETEPTVPETEPTEPETEPTTVPVTEPTEPETEPTTVPVTEPTEPETEPTTVPVTEPTEPETEPTESETTEPTEPETTVPTEPTPGESKPIIPDEDVNGDNNNGNVNSDANNNNSNVDNDADNNNSNNSNVNDGATSTPDTIEPNDNGVIKTGVAVSVVSISFIIAIISLAVLFILNNRKNKYNH